MSMRRLQTRWWMVGNLATWGLATFGAASAVADNWPQWRGARHDGVSTEAPAAAAWDLDADVQWSLPLPGPAGSTPVLWEDRLFLTSAAGEELLLLCISTRGEELWRRSLSDGNETVRSDEGNYASPSPATDGQHVWTFVGTGALACHTTEGQPVWQFNVQDRYGALQIQFGMASTPLLHEGRLYLQLIHGDGNPQTREALVVCLDAASGEEIWQAARPSDGRDECEHSYASPTLFLDGPAPLLLTHGADYLVAHRLTDGSEVWRLGGMNPPGNYNPTLRFVASPVAAEGMIVVPSAKGGPVFGLTGAGQGDVTRNEQAVKWRMPRNTPDVPSPLIHDGLVYLCRENGALICVDAETGEELYQERLIDDRHRASPLWVDGKIYVASRRGVVSVVKAGREFELLARNAIGEEISASPIFADGVFYVRTFESLKAIGRQP
jgi:outer membrane protein assembly factor BamB